MYNATSIRSKYAVIKIKDICVNCVSNEGAIAECMNAAYSRRRIGCNSGLNPLKIVLLIFMTGFTWWIKRGLSTWKKGA
jgi:hypothetical protein